MELVPDPFPHVVIDGLWDDGLLERVIEEFPSPDDQRWIHYTDDRFETKSEGGEHMFGPAAEELVAGIADLGPRLADAFATPPLILRTEGGGYHETQPGGKLAVHADFNVSEEGLYRRLNVIVYLNEDWGAGDGGELELWDGDGPVATVAPTFNRTLVFETSDHSFHGHPTPLPGPRSRRSFAAYFFSEQPPADFDTPHTTIWHPSQ